MEKQIKKLKAFRLSESLINDLQQLANNDRRSLSNYVEFTLINNVKQTKIKAVAPVKPIQKNNDWITLTELHSKLNVIVSEQRFLKTLLNSSVDYKRIDQIYYFKNETELHN